MKYALLILSASSLLLFSFKKKEEKVSVAELKKAFVESCLKEALSEDDSPELQKIFKEFCTCSGDNIFEQISAEDFESMESTVGEDEMIQLLYPYIESCVANLELQLKKAEAE